MTSYYEKLKDPRWQRKRLEILNRSDFSCEQCGGSEKTLHVHHKLYRKGAMPWDYADHELTSLCDQCHEHWHKAKSLLDLIAADLSIPEILKLVGVGVGMAFENGQFTRLRATDSDATSGSVVEGLCAWLDADHKKAIKLADSQGWIDIDDIPRLKNGAEK